jgi:rubrerythrin
MRCPHKPFVYIERNMTHHTDTIADLFTIAAAAERAAMNFYKGLARSFSYVPQVSLFWEDMMRDEAFHIQELMDIRNMLTDEQLFEPADRSIIIKEKNELERLAEKFDLKAVVTLDDAYEIAYELEYSEVNMVFRAMVSKFVSSETRSKFVLSQVRDHVAKLEDFSKSIANLENRRNILARHH